MQPRQRGPVTGAAALVVVSALLLAVWLAVSGMPLHAPLPP